MIRGLANAAGAFAIVFFLYGVVSSAYLAGHGFTYGWGFLAYVGLSAFVYAALGALIGVASGVTVATLGRVEWLRLRGDWLERAYHFAAATSLLYFAHFAIRFLTGVLWVHEGPHYRENLTAWLVLLAAGFALAALAALAIYARGRDGRRSFVVTTVAAAAATALALVWHLGPRPVLDGAAGNVFIISIDTLRADHLSAFGGRGVDTPALDALARDGVVFRSAFSTAPYTWPALSSSMTGMFTLRHGVRVNGTKLPDEHLTIAELFQSQGYATTGISDIGLRWLGLGQGFERLLRDRTGLFEMQPFRRILPGFTFFSNWFATGHGEITSSLPQTLSALRWLGTLDRPDRNFFWMHFYDDAPHEPYTSPEPFFSMYVPDGNGSDFDGGFAMLERLNTGELEPTQDDRTRIRALYEGETTWCDVQIDSLVRALKRRGLYESSTIVVFSDHGQQFGRRNAWGHGEFLFNSLLHVPLLIKPPAGAGYRTGTAIEAPVSLVDLLPTLSEMYDLAIPGGIDGQSLVPFLRDGEHPGRPFWHFAETLLYDRSMKPLGGRGSWRVGYAVMDEGWKAIAAPASDEYHLYRLSDHDEEHPVDDPARIRRMEEDAASRFGLASPAALLEVATSEISDDDRARLRALGYILE